MKELATNTLKSDIENSGEMKTYLKGRSLACAYHMGEVIPSDYEELIIDILDMCAKFSQEERFISIKLVAIKTLLKYSRKVKD